MNFKITKKIGALVFILAVSISNIRAQDGDFTTFLNAGSQDASTLMGNYLNPVFTGLGFGVANGWYNTAAAHKPLGFDLTVTVNAAFAPDDDLFFDIVESEYENLELDNPNFPSTSSLFGDETTTTVNAIYTEQGVTIQKQFEAPPGLSLDDQANGIIPTPMIQLGVGLVKNTDLKLRWMPTIENNFGENDFRMTMFGVGLMHDFKQWIPAIKHIPIDMSVLVGYNRINVRSDIEGALNGDNQEAEFGVNSWTYQLLVSKKLSVLTVYGGFGYNNTNTNLEVRGTYEIESDVSGVGVTLTDPVNETFISNGMRGTLGMRLKLGFFTIHGDYTFQKYNTLTVGIGLSVR